MESGSQMSNKERHMCMNIITYLKFYGVFAFLEALVRLLLFGLETQVPILSLYFFYLDFYSMPLTTFLLMPLGTIHILQMVLAGYSLLSSILLFVAVSKRREMLIVPQIFSHLISIVFVFIQFDRPFPILLMSRIILLSGLHDPQSSTAIYYCYVSAMLCISVYTFWGLIDGFRSINSHNKEVSIAQ